MAGSSDIFGSIYSQLSGGAQSALTLLFPPAPPPAQFNTTQLATGQTSVIPTTLQSSSPYATHIAMQQRQMPGIEPLVPGGHPSEALLSERYGTRYQGMSNIITVKPNYGLDLRAADQSISSYLRNVEAIQNPERTLANVSLQRRQSAIDDIYKDIQRLGYSTDESRARYTAAEQANNAAMDALARVPASRYSLHAEQVPGMTAWLQGKGPSPIGDALLRAQSPPSVERAQGDLGVFPAEITASVDTVSRGGSIGGDQILRGIAGLSMVTNPVLAPVTLPFMAAAAAAGIIDNIGVKIPSYPDIERALPSFGAQALEEPGGMRTVTETRTETVTLPPEVRTITTVEKSPQNQLLGINLDPFARIFGFGQSPSQPPGAMPGNVTAINETFNTHIQTVGDVTERVNETVRQTTITNVTQQKSENKELGILGIGLGALSAPFDAFMAADKAVSRSILTYLGHGDYETGLANLNKAEDDWTRGAGAVIRMPYDIPGVGMILPGGAALEAYSQINKLVTGTPVAESHRQAAEFVADVPFGAGAQWLRSPLTAGAWATFSVMTAGVTELAGPTLSRIMSVSPEFIEAHATLGPKLDLLSRGIEWTVPKALAGLYGLDVASRVAGSERPGGTFGQIITGEFIPLYGGAVFWQAEKQLVARALLEGPNLPNLGEIPGMALSRGRGVVWSIEDAIGDAWVRMRYPEVSTWTGPSARTGTGFDVAAWWAESAGPVVEVGGEIASTARFPELPSLGVQAVSPTESLPAIFGESLNHFPASVNRLPVPASSVGDFDVLTTLPVVLFEPRVAGPFRPAAYYPGGRGSSAWPGYPGQYLPPELDMPSSPFGRTSSGMGARPISQVIDKTLDLEAFDRLGTPRGYEKMGRETTETADRIMGTLASMRAGWSAKRAATPVEWMPFSQKALAATLPGGQVIYSPPALPASVTVSTAARPTVTEGYISPPVMGLPGNVLNRLWPAEMVEPGWTTIFTGMPKGGQKWTGLPTFDLSNVVPETTFPAVYTGIEARLARESAMDALFYRMTKFDPLSREVVDVTQQWRGIEGTRDLLASLSSPSFGVGGIGAGRSRGFPGGGRGGVIDLGEIGHLGAIRLENIPDVTKAITRASSPVISLCPGPACMRGAGEGTSALRGATGVSTIIKAPTINIVDVLAAAEKTDISPAFVDYASINRATQGVSDRVNWLLGFYTPPPPKPSETLLYTSRLPDVLSDVGATPKPVFPDFDEITRLQRLGRPWVDLPTGLVGKRDVSMHPLGERNFPVSIGGKTYFTTPDIVGIAGEVPVVGGGRASIEDVLRGVGEVSLPGARARLQTGVSTIGGVDAAVMTDYDVVSRSITDTITRQIERQIERQTTAQVTEQATEQVQRQIQRQIQDQITETTETTTEVTVTKIKFPDIPTIPDMPTGFPGGAMLGGGGRRGGRKYDPFQKIFVYHPVPTLEAAALIELPVIKTPTFNLPKFNF